MRCGRCGGGGAARSGRGGAGPRQPPAQRLAGAGAHGAGKRPHARISGKSLRELLALVRYQAPSQIALSTNVADNLRCLLPEGQLRQALLNLVLNAIQALASQPGSVVVAAERADGMLKISVADDGPGFPAEFLSQRIQAFKTGRSFRHGPWAGHGEPLCARSRRHARTVQPGAERRLRRPRPALWEFKLSDSLLVIEDEALLGAELARHFRREGWEVVLAPHLAAARALLDDERAPLVVLSDMQLPDGNALDLLAEVREARGAAASGSSSPATAASPTRCARCASAPTTSSRSPATRSAST